MTYSPTGRMTDLVYYIKKRRKELGLTQADVASSCGFSIRKYQRIEGGSVCIGDFVKVSSVLKFKVILLPEECEIVKL